MAILRLSGIIGQTIVDGPGLRLAVYTQGCPHACPGCHNPESHDFNGGFDKHISEIFEMFLKNPLLTGITFSGGEPFAQAQPLAVLAELVRQRGKTVFCFTGYTFEELLRISREDKGVRNLLPNIDVLVDGRYVQEEKDLSLRFRGSRNQRVLDLPKSLALAEAVVAEGY